MKAETIVGLIFLIVAGLVLGIVASVYSPAGHLKYQPDIPEKIITEQPPARDENQISNYTKFVTDGKNVCEGCHLSGKKSIPQAYQVKQHVEGGAYCLTCHKIDHDVHPMTPNNKNVTCQRCHGIEGKIPEFFKGTISCAECHDFPDALKPSNGNIIVIHRPRDVDCVKCHIAPSSGSCLKCHGEIKSDQKWEKRLAHFNTILGTVR